jgi:hypothetical protein
MINKLYNFKNIQLDQQIVQKKQLLSKIFDIDEKIEQTKMSLSTATVKIFGSIGDFKVLAIHKNSMKFEIVKLEKEKKILQGDIAKYDKVIMELQKELEQYGYILKEETKKRLKKDAKNDEMVASEYMQSKWMAS